MPTRKLPRKAQTPVPAAPELEVRAAARDGTSRRGRDSSAEHGNAEGNEQFYVARAMPSSRETGRTGTAAGRRRREPPPSTGGGSESKGRGPYSESKECRVRLRTVGPTAGRAGTTATVPPAAGPERPAHMVRPKISSTAALLGRPSNARFSPERWSPQWGGWAPPRRCRPPPVRSSHRTWRRHPPRFPRPKPLQGAPAMPSSAPSSGRAHSGAGGPQRDGAARRRCGAATPTFPRPQPLLGVFRACTARPCHA